MEPQEQENDGLRVIEDTASKAQEDNILKEQEASSLLLKSLMPLPEKLVVKAEPYSLARNKDKPKAHGSQDSLSKTHASQYSSADGLQVLPPKAHESQYLPPKAHLSQNLQPRALGSQYLPPKAHAAQYLHPNAHGSQFVAPKVHGSQALPPKAHISRYQSIIVPNNLQDNEVGSTTETHQDKNEDLKDYMNLLFPEGLLGRSLFEQELLYAIAMHDVETEQVSIENVITESNNEQPKCEQSMSEDQQVEENIALRERDLAAMVFDATTMEPSDFEAAATLQFLAAMCGGRAAIEAAPAQPIPAPNIQQVLPKKRRARKMAREDCRKIAKTSSSYITNLIESDIDEQPINEPCFSSPPQKEALRLVKANKPDEDIGKKQAHGI